MNEIFGTHKVKDYIVSISEDSFSCTCPDFQYRKHKTGQPCKHVAQVMQEFELRM